MDAYLWHWNAGTKPAAIEQLQSELNRERLKNLALTTMIEVAEEELHIDIRKKAGAKQ